MSYFCYTLWGISVTRCELSLLHVTTYLCYTLWVISVTSCEVSLLHIVSYLCYMLWVISVTRCELSMLQVVSYLCNMLWVISVTCCVLSLLPAFLYFSKYEDCITFVPKCILTIKQQYTYLNWFSVRVKDHECHNKGYAFFYQTTRWNINHIKITKRMFSKTYTINFCHRSML